MKKHNLSEGQIKRATESGLVRTRTVRNPYYSSAAPATLLYEEDLLKNLDRIRKLGKPPLSQKEKDRLRYERKQEVKKKEQQTTALK